MSGGGVGNVLSTGASLAAGQSPMGAFGSALGSQLLSGGGGGSGAGAPAGGIGGIGRQNQTQLVGPMAGVNPAANQFFNNQPRPQVLPQVTPQVQGPQVGARLFNGVVTPNTIGPNGLPVGSGMGISGGMGDTFNRPLVQLPAQGGGIGGVFGAQIPRQMDLSQDAYRTFLAQAQFSGQPPTYDQWVQQRQAPMPAVMPQKPGVPGFGLSTAMQPYFQELAQQAVQQPQVSQPQVPGFGLSTAMQPYFQELAQRAVQQPQVFPQKPGLSTTMQPRPQVSPPNPGLGLAGIANALQGQYK